MRSRKNDGLPPASELVAGLTEDARRQLREAGFDVDAWPEQAATREGAARIQNVLLEVQGRFGVPELPGRQAERLRRARQDRGRTDGSTARLLDELSADDRRRLDEQGVNWDRLRAMCDTADGARRVRMLLAQYTGVVAEPGLPEDQLAERRARFVLDGRASGAGVGAVARFWSGTLALALLGLALTAASTLLIGEGALFVAIVYFAVVGPWWYMSHLVDGPGWMPVTLLMLVGYATLAGLLVFNTSYWYLAVHGTQAKATVVKPRREKSRSGVWESYCRVRLPGGSVRQTEGNANHCTARVGSRRDVVYDPAGFYRPALGTKADLDVGVSATVGVGAAAVLVVAPAESVIAATRRRGKVYG